jgi:4-oxalocrotonate tautomerase
VPFVRISASSDHAADALRAIADAVHEAMVDTIGIPAADRFQVVTKHAEGEMIWDRTYLDVQRSNSAVFVHITLSVGRDDATKRALYARIVANVTSRTNVCAGDVLIVLSENTRVDWSFGNGIAQYVPGE